MVTFALLAEIPLIANTRMRKLLYINIFHTRTYRSTATFRVYETRVTAEPTY